MRDLPFDQVVQAVQRIGQATDLADIQLPGVSTTAQAIRIALGSGALD